MHDVIAPAAFAGGIPQRRPGAAPRDPDGLAALTLRQREVLALMADGLSNAAIARRLVVTEKAVVQHCSNIYAALDLPPTPDEHRRVLAVLRYVCSQQHRVTMRSAPRSPALSSDGHAPARR